MHKHYGGIDWFNGKSTKLLSQCLDNAVKKEQEIPKLILEIINALTDKNYSISSMKSINKKMRSKEEIYKDYGMKVGD